jgi:prolyl oligopeptidase PreP (S9A serine peptidase family)
VAAQNVRARAYLDALPGRPAIAGRIRQALDVGRVATAVPRGRYLFLTRREAGMDQVVLTVSEAGGPARVLVDPAPLSEDRTTALAWWTPSPDGELVCAGISEVGDDDAELRILRTATGEWLPDRMLPTLVSRRAPDLTDHRWRLWGGLSPFGDTPIDAPSRQWSEMRLPGLRNLQHSPGLIEHRH